MAKAQAQPKIFGVTEKIVRRLSTIITLPDTEYDYSYKIIGKEDSNNFYILETLDGINYRAMAPWMESKKYSMLGKYALPIIKYIKENIPDRSTNYQSIVIEKSLKNMFIAKPLSLDSMAEHAKDIDTQIIKNELFLKIKDIIRELVEAHDIKTYHDINDVIHNESIKDTFVNVILIMYKMASKYTDLQEFDAGKFPFSEIFSSFIVELQTITRLFMKNLHDAYNRALPSSDIFTLQKREKNNLIINHLDEILLHTLQIVIGDNSNIYSALNYKYLLLNFA